MDYCARRLFGSLALAGSLAVAVPAAVAQGYPEKPVSLVVGFAPGGPNDILGRLIAKALSERLGQPFVVENQAGGSSNPATEAVVRAQPDGYTLLLVGPANTINVSLFPNLPFDFLRDINPVAGISREPLVLVVHPSLPARNVAEFIAYVKANPGKVKMASTGNGSAPHVSALLFMTMAELDMPLVHFGGGGPALKELIAGGQVQAMFEPMSASIEPVRTGKLRPLAVSTATRSEALPEVPALADTVPGYEASAATGIGVPAKTPAAVVEKLNREINAALADSKLSEQLKDAGGTPLPGSPAEFKALLAAEIEKWAKVLKAAGVKPN
jgi:tripartite-type tricarboxylate transporter receptor subunit TctC